jgi:RNA polymerase sigma-70 factor (ECF subfamily)
LDQEIEFVERARNGDKAAFKELVMKYKKLVYYLAYDITRCKEDAEDISQEVFIKAYRSLNKFRGDSKFSSWLYSITYNTCLTFKSSKNYTTMKISENIEDVAEWQHEQTVSRGVSPERSAESGFMKQNIEKALEKLSHKEKTIFIMRNISEMPFNEIVEVLKLKPGTVRSANFKALKKLRKDLAIYEGEI